MSGSGGSGRGRDRNKGGRGLSDEDEHLWAHTARTITRGERLKPRVHTSADIADGQQAGGLHGHARHDPRGEAREGHRNQRPALRHETRVVDHAQQTPPKPHPVAQPSASAKAPPLADFDRKKARHIGAGRIEIDARIDLHGLRQSEAHAALRRFILTSHGRGCRWVLVITGKGAPLSQSREPDDDGGAWWRRGLATLGYGSEGERGVLRRNVPRWLSEPELRSFIVSYTTAAVRHGGDGALYVHLRSRTRIGG